MAIYSIRAAHLDEMLLVQQIERRAAARLATVGLPAAADLPVQPIEALQTACRQGRILVTVDEEDTAVGFAIFDLYEDEGHLLELDVVPEHAGNGLGRRLIEDVIARTRAAGLPRLILTTFRDIPFNAPFYARLGFGIVDEANLSPRLARIREAERRMGCDLAPRVAMILEV